MEATAAGMKAYATELEALAGTGDAEASRRLRFVNETVVSHGEGCRIPLEYDALYTVSIGAAAVAVAVKDDVAGNFRPILVVAESVRRRYRTGIGQYHEYSMMAGGFPNFEKAIRNAAERACDISIAIEDGEAVEPIELKDLSKDQISAPEGVVCQPTSDGRFALHIPSVKVGRDAAEKIFSILRNEF